MQDAALELSTPSAVVKNTRGNSEVLTNFKLTVKITFHD
jgi:hypothetical protein